MSDVLKSNALAHHGRGNTLTMSSCSLFCFYIKPQLAFACTAVSGSCSLFCFYIKPQRSDCVLEAARGCSLFCFYIKPQLINILHSRTHRCSLFCFYIKPQHRRPSILHTPVVPYSVSTSNHNADTPLFTLCVVVPYSVSTSNHNRLNLMTLSK